MSAACEDGSVLVVDDLVVEFPGDPAPVRALDHVSFAVRRGQRVALVGESGSGKSTLALAALGLVPSPGEIVSGRVRTVGVDITAARANQLRQVRGGSAALVFQDALGSLNPVLSIGTQLVETIRTHRGLAVGPAREAAAQALAEVGIADAETRLNHYPHEFSGGMRQRVMIAMALACEPDILIADEPTTALDVTTEASIMALLDSIATERQMAILLITHDLGLVSRFADHVVVLYAGGVVESGPAQRVFGDPRHPYTRRLLGAVPRLDAPAGRELPTIPGTLPDLRVRQSGCRFAPRCTLARATCRDSNPEPEPFDWPRVVACHFAGEIDEEEALPAPARSRPAQERRPLLAVAGLSKEYRSRRGWTRRAASFRAVDDVGFAVSTGEAFGLVGESGAGKSTVGRILLGLTSATAGDVTFGGSPLSISGRDPGRSARDIQVIFQDPGDSLNPRLRLSRIVAEPLLLDSVPARDAARRVDEVLELVGLPGEFRDRRPDTLSGGQKQRVAIARALASSPRLLVCDEAVSSLDVSVRAQILNLLKRIQSETGIAYLFISHDLAVVRHVCDRMAVMRRGRIVEQGDVEQVVSAPEHEYTRRLLAAASGRHQQDPVERVR